VFFRLLESVLHDTMMSYVLPKKEEKAAYVKDMFAQIAANYDQANRAMTFGMDQGWRHRVIELAAPLVNGYALDLGTGTGDFLPLLAEWMPDGVVVGVDSCLPMMHKGSEKIRHLAGIASFVGGDALHLPFPDNLFDVITTGFTIRNVTDIAATFCELWRVASAGGVLVCLEVAQPRSPLVQVAHQVYFKYLVPRIGGLLSGNLRAYEYLYHSARHFPPPDMLARLIQAAGWQHVDYTLHSLGAVAIHKGVKL
jgi:demethylmenaquinone methyltransferase/2-methoxy-6-polyprenyl-1,4-benzoquinol methylase